ncbi:pentatricopeptide repeat-containing protein At1g14470 [Vicia villosa]|uniref:pentatricopeptide repeat-containing protein At1g14470 n=1 Tax=Vicia villosa TaxID=3911 RepID=UPI00273B4907|nr:pentatricopeptide repeat-containing protein At1g14470 [Vicia villosa]XP_058767202.1 pentatricopeptide repeat-containing protein At1g14470 [Vicia villosa]
MSALNKNSIVSKITNLHRLRQLHAQLVHRSLHHQNHLVALLLTHCTRLHAPSTYTSHIFHLATHPDLRLFTCMLKYYSRIGAHTQLLLSFFKHMLHHYQINPDASFYALLIKSARNDSIFFLPHLLKSGHSRDHYVRNGILAMYAKYGPIEFARKLFDEMTDRTVADWNVMISGYWKCGDEDEASKLFYLMGEQQSIRRNVITWTTMISGYAKNKNLKTARMYFDKMPERSVVSWNAILSGYAQGRAPQETVRLFNDMLSSGNVEPDETTWVTVISSCSSLSDPCLSEFIVRELDNRISVRSNYFVKTALLDMYAKCGNLEAAQEIFEQLGVYKYRSSVPWNAMISAHARVGDISLARHLFDKMPHRDTVSWNSMIAGYTQNGESFMAIKLFEEMISSEDSKPDEVTMVSVFSACGHLGELSLGNWALSILKENNIRISISGYNSLIYMYSRCGSMEDAALIFQEMVTRDLVSYNTLISGFAEHGQGLECIKLLSKMKKDGIEPDRITYIAILTACSHAGLLEEGQKVFESIKFPDVDHYACMIDMLGRVGRLEEAVELIQSMPMEPHAGIYGSLLNATNIHKRVELGELAAAKLFKIEPHNSGNYVLLANMYALAGRWKDVDRVRDAMTKQGVKKTTGWSWLEHNL